MKGIYSASTAVSQYVTACQHLTQTYIYNFPSHRCRRLTCAFCLSLQTRQQIALFSTFACFLETPEISAAPSCTAFSATSFVLAN